MFQTAFKSKNRAWELGTIFLVFSDDKEKVMAYVLVLICVFDLFS